MRSFQSPFSGKFLEGLQAGVLRYTYRGVPCLKNPIDTAIYTKLIWDLRPATIIEIGSNAGGSALLLADIVSNFGLGCHIYSVDLRPPAGISDSRITFLEGDVLRLEPVFDKIGLADLSHPWFAIEDSAHTHAACLAALRSFSKVMVADDMLVMEDGILEELGLARQYEGGPNRAIASFFEEQPDVFEIVTELCDMFGRNATYNPNAYLRKL